MQHHQDSQQSGQSTPLLGLGGSRSASESHDSVVASPHSWSLWQQLRRLVFVDLDQHRPAQGRYADTQTHADIDNSTHALGVALAACILEDAFLGHIAREPDTQDQASSSRSTPQASYQTLAEASSAKQHSSGGLGTGGTHSTRRNGTLSHAADLFAHVRPYTPLEVYLAPVFQATSTALYTTFMSTVAMMYILVSYCPLADSFSTDDPHASSHSGHRVLCAVETTLLLLLFIDSLWLVFLAKMRGRHGVDMAMALFLSLAALASFIDVGYTYSRIGSPSYAPIYLRHFFKPAFLIAQRRHARSIVQIIGKASVYIVPYMGMIGALILIATVALDLILPSTPPFNSLSSGYYALLVYLTGSNAPAVLLEPLHTNGWVMWAFALVYALAMLVLLSGALAIQYGKTKEGLRQHATIRTDVRQKGCMQAFNVLDKVSLTGIDGKIDSDTMTQLLRQLGFVDNKYIPLVLSILDTDNSGEISREEFAAIFNLFLMDIRIVRVPRPLLRLPYHVALTRWCVKGHLALASDLVLLANVAVVAETLSSQQNIKLSSPPTWSIVVQLLMAIAYLLEKSLTLVLLGWRHIAFSVTAGIDFILVVVFFAGRLDLAIANVSLVPVWLPRALMLLRLPRLVRFISSIPTCDVIMWAIARLLQQLPTVAVITLAAYHIFAFLGVVCLHDKLGDSPVLANSSYVEEGLQVFNFDSPSSASMVLWIMQIQTSDWHMIADAAALATSDGIYVYFFTWLFVSVVIFNVLLSFILDAFGYHLKSRPVRQQFDVRSSRPMRHSESGIVNRVEAIETDRDNHVQDTSEQQPASPGGIAAFQVEGRALEPKMLSERTQLQDSQAPASPTVEVVYDSASHFLGLLQGIANS